MAWPLDATLPGWLVAVVGAIGVIRMGRRVWAAAREQRQLVRAAQPFPADWLPGLDMLATQAGLPLSPRLVLVDGANPASGSLFGPVIVLPRAALAWREATRHAVLAHECVHLAARDDCWRLLAGGLVSLYWFLPWLGVLEDRLLKAMEERCDDRAAVLCGGETGYLDALVQIARAHIGEPPASSLVALLRERSGHLLHRVRRFALPRFVHVDSRAVYWSVAGLLTFTLLVSGVQPVVESAVAVSPPEGVNRTLALLPSTVDSAFPRVTLRAEAVDATASPTRLALPDHLPSPMYPGHALLAGLEGQVVVVFTVADDGSVVRPMVRFSSQPVFEAAALRFTRGLRFTPEQLPVPIRLPTPARGPPAPARQAMLRFDYRLH